MTRRFPLPPARAGIPACVWFAIGGFVPALASTSRVPASSPAVQLSTWALAIAIATYTITRWLTGRLACPTDPRVRDLFEGVPIGLYRSTPDGEILDANRNLVELLGYPNRGTLLATAAARLYVDPSDRERWKAVVRENGEVRAFEARMRRHTGGVIWARQSVRAVVGTDGRIEYEGAIEDITERTRAERALRISEERYGAAFEQAAIGLAEVSPAGRFLRVNRYLCERLGYTEAELLQKTVIDVTHPEDVSATQDYLATAPETAGPYRREKRYMKKDGTPLWSQLTTSLVRTPDGGSAFFITVIEDLSERKRLESQLLHAQKLEAVGQLAGGVAHDFSNLIGAIQGYAQLVERTLAPEDPRRADIGEIRKAGQRASGLIHQLLTFARRQETQPQLVEVNGLLTNLGRLVGRVLGSDIKVSWGLPDDLPAIKVDPGQFEQVILNLAINARDAMPDGGTLGIETSLVHVDQAQVSRLRGSRPGPHVMVTVSDTGTGMPREVLDRIFEPFFTTKGPDRGTGLGLSICYGIVKQAGGNIWVYSELGHGTTFRLYFPAVFDGAGALSVPESDPELPGGTERLLLVEDDPQMRALAVRVLTDCGYDITAAPDAEAAMAEVASGTADPALLVTDLILPGMTGLQLAQALRAESPGLKVLCMTGQADRVSSSSRRQQGFALIEKPFTAQTLARAVRDCLDKGPATP
ncbi:MAG TPA: PAS domain S-box protein [Gemmatimonadales bacterium]|nr:PAS domain S-box protein [Gemmatimonadales bacterium]